MGEVAFNPIVKDAIPYPIPENPIISPTYNYNNQTLSISNETDEVTGDKLIYTCPKGVIAFLFSAYLGAIQLSANEDYYGLTKIKIVRAGTNAEEVVLKTYVEPPWNNQYAIPGGYDSHFKPSIITITISYPMPLKLQYGDKIYLTCTSHTSIAYCGLQGNTQPQT